MGTLGSGTRNSRRTGLETFAWDLSLNIFRLECFAWELSMRIYRLAIVAWYFSLRNFVWDRPLWTFRLETVAWDLSLGNFRLVTGVWEPSFENNRLGFFTWNASCFLRRQPRQNCIESSSSRAATTTLTQITSLVNLRKNPKQTKTKNAMTWRSQRTCIYCQIIIIISEM